MYLLAEKRLNLATGKGEWRHVGPTYAELKDAISGGMILAGYGLIQAVEIVDGFTKRIVADIAKVDGEKILHLHEEA